jgi:hypothetical protein
VENFATFQRLKDFTKFISDSGRVQLKHALPAEHYQQPVNNDPFNLANNILLFFGDHLVESGTSPIVERKFLFETHVSSTELYSDPS